MYSRLIKFNKIGIILIICLLIISSMAIVSASHLSELIGDEDALHVLQACISTGSGLSDKTYASFQVGPEFANENIKIQIYYSRDGVHLNEGKIVPKTISPDGYIDVRSADSYKYYPDRADIYIYDEDEILIDSTTLYLSPNDDKQTFNLERYESESNPSRATLAISEHFDDYVKNSD